MSSSSRAQFDAQAERYAASAAHRRGPSMPVVLEFAAPQPDDVVLDVATGAGSTAVALAPLVARVTGIDVAPRMLEQARRRAEEEGVENAEFLEGDAERLPFADASFTLVTARHAPHHFRDAAAFLREVARVLVPGGRFVMADQVTLDPALRSWVDEVQRTRDPSHFTQRTIAEWRELVEAVGLRWSAERVVNYRLEFDWWVTQSGCRPERVEHLIELFAGAPRAFGVERRADGSPLAHLEPVLVALAVKPA